MRVAVAGCKHFHVCSIVKSIVARPDLELVAVAEDDLERYGEYVAKVRTPVVYGSVEELFDKAEFDILLVGDAFGKRGAHVIRALESGRHVLADKPFCTRLEELNRIRTLQEEKGLSVIVALTCRYDSSLRRGRRMLLDGAVGEVVTVDVLGHHPLNYRSGRPDWYFEPGMHGGTINDLMIHAVDALGWATGHRVVEVVAARAWNAGLPEVPFFQDAALAFLRLENDAGALIDASYKAPVGHLSTWIFDFYGTGGRLTISLGGGVTVQRHREPEEKIPAGPLDEGGFVADLVAEIMGDSPRERILTTSECLDAAEKSLRIQSAADNGESNVLI